MTNRNFIAISHESVVVLNEHPTEHRGRSIIIGVTQAFLNLPRMVFVGLYKSLIMISSSFILGFGALILATVVAPLMNFITCIVLGFRGRLTIDGDDVIENQQTARLLMCKPSKGE